MIRINLLPRERVRRRGVGPRALWMVLAVIVVAALAVYTMALTSRINARKAELAGVEDQITQLRPKVARVEELRKQIEAAQRKEKLLRLLEASRVPWDKILEELRTVMPTDVWLSQVELRDGGDLVFNGYGMTYESVARFMVSLEASPMFKDVDMLISQKQTVVSKEVVNFSLTGKLSLERKGAELR